MRVQAFLTAMAVNLKRLAAAIALFLAALSDLLAGLACQHDRAMPRQKQLADRWPGFEQHRRGPDNSAAPRGTVAKTRP